ncbi:MAG: CARDB domain-containing protein [Candidatus Hodarchaeota archaeon]
MKNSTVKKIISIFLIIILFSSIFNATVITQDSKLNELTFSRNEAITISDITGDFIYTLNGRDYVAEYITKETIEKMKENIILRDINKDYNDIVDGHGTGLAPPTEEELDKLLGKVSILGVHSDSDFRFPAAAVDISTEIFFAPVGDQGGQGSCTAWANTYYAYGYLEAKDYSWDASSGNTDYLLSPAWVYNKIAAFDYGSMPIDAGECTKQWGVATLTTMPYNDVDYYSWGEEPAWREAPYHRALDFSLITYVDYSSINTIKTFLDGSIPVTFGIDAYEFWNGLNDTTGDYILSSEEYLATGSLNHAQCIVGYDDAITEGGDIGAFRVVNSWGEEWMDDGFYWITYNAFHEIGNYPNQFIGFYTDIIDHQPTLISTWEFSSPPTRMDDIITLGVGPHDTPLDTIIPLYDWDENFLFPEFMALDISDFQSYYNLDNDVFFFLEIGPSLTTGRISTFNIERYVGGTLVETAYSLDVPSLTPGYYNCTFKVFSHELKVLIEIPENLQIFNTYMINATVINNGINAESNVELYLYLDSVLIDSTTIPNLPAGVTEKLNYLWTPNVQKIYNFTAYAPPVPGETYTSNNYRTELFSIYQNYYMYDGYPYTWVDATGGTALSLTDDGYTAIALPFLFPFYDQNFSTIYLGANGYLSFSDSSPSDYSNDPLPSGNSEHYYLIAPFWDDLLTAYAGGSGEIYIQSFGTYWVAEWYNIEHYNEYIVGTFEVILYDSGDIMFSYDYLDYMDGYTCGLNLGADTRYYNSYQGLSLSTDDFSILFSYERFSHDLSVSLDTPLDPELLDTYLITATVNNDGTNDENNVFLSLYLDSVLVNSTTISILSIGVSETISYEWTPTSYALYNFTVIALPVPGEIYTSNNILTKQVLLLDITLFDGMYIEHVLDFNGYIIDSKFTYSYLSGNLFHLSWDVEYAGMPAQSYWDEDYTTRMMYNPGGNFLIFTPGIYTPVWIFTDVNVGDNIPIAVDGEGDHTFRIARSLVYDLPGFGKIGIWELVDQSAPGGILWYEKSTGILINGTFVYSGSYYYTFDFVDTNLEFEYVTGGDGAGAIPGYNLFIILGILCIITIFSLKMKHRRKIEF